MRLIDADKLHLKLLDMDFPIQDQDPILDAMDNCVVDAPPNDPLTLEQLREMDEPVWVECGITPFTPDGGYYCLCNNGSITTPSGTQYIAEDIPHWKFYRRKPEEGET